MTNTWARNILILLILIDVMTKENKGFQSRLDDYCTDSEDDSKEVTLMGLLGRMQWQLDMYVAGR